MANIKEVKNIIKRVCATERTRKQNILLVGDHGIVKSEILTNMYEEMGYRMITIFVGQMADAGDFIGLPSPSTMNVEIKTRIMVPELGEDGVPLLDSKGKAIMIQAVDEDGKLRWLIETDTFDVTDFNPPKWWPFDPDELVVIFLDEANRGKPETNQCLMDLLLNKKLNGRYLPKNSMIIGAMNPLKDGYDVGEFDQAFFDRWIVYDFKPTVKEWVEHAVKSKVNNYIISFIQKNHDLLDPPEKTTYGEVYASRRSWFSVDAHLEAMNFDGNEDDLNEIMLLMGGIVGTDIASVFPRHVREMRSGIHASTIVTKWDKKLEKEIKQSYTSPDLTIMNLQIINFLKDSASDMSASTAIGMKYATNLGYYLEAIPKECMADFISLLTDYYDKGGEDRKWTEVLTEHNKDISDKFIQVLTGSHMEEESDDLYN